MDWEAIRESVEPICRAADIKMLAVFGSMARHEESPHSDVDLLARFGSPIGFIELFNIQSDLQKVFDRPVDLGTEDSLHPLIKDNVKKDLRIIYEG